ncbi:MAG: glycosyltransferase family protein [Rikenellaceae bacterium]
MRYIFVIQGEGRGHLTQALALSHMLRRNGHQVSEVLVGRCKNRELPKFFAEKIDAPVTQFDSPTFDYGQNGKRGRVLKTIFNNTTPVKMNKWRKSINVIYKHIKRSECDVVINFYEFLLGATAMIYNIETPIICIGHQFMIDHRKFEQTHSEGGTLMLRLNNHICSYGAYKRLALSFYPMKRDISRHIEVVPPLLRPEIFSLESSKEDFVLGYMLNPAYLVEIVTWKSHNPDTKIHLFWDKIGAAECEERMPGLWLHKINDSLFLELMAKCSGYITTAGFESICEAMYLGKPVVMIPAHVEQQINAADARSVGAGEIADEFNLTLLKSAIKNYNANTEEFREWVDSAEKRMLRALTDI